MRGLSTLRVACLAYLCVCAAGAARAQTDDEMIETIRTRTDIGESDQDRIRGWVEGQIGRFSSFKEFRDRFRTLYEKADNTQQFRTQLPTQAARVAANQFADGTLKGDTAHAVAQILVDFDRIETRAALVECLRSTDARARYLCADGLASLKRQIAGDNAVLQQTVDALREAGPKEPSGVVLGRIYDALAMPDKTAIVFDTYMQLFDTRLAVRRNSGAVNNGPELYAYEFFRTASVRAALDQNQKVQLVARLAVFLRIDAERYTAPHLGFDEIDLLERMMDAVEEILVAVVGEGGGKVREALSSGGVQAAATVLAEARRWVGDPGSNTAGVLNQAPWNVPIGAP